MSRQWAAAAFNTTSGERLWYFITPLSSGEATDSVTSISITPGGEIVAVGSWGDLEHLNAQVGSFPSPSVRARKVLIL
jgi:hypothetical protein